MLGMHHDGDTRFLSSTGCPKDGFVMSASRGTAEGEIRWSNCSKKFVQSLNMDCLHDDNTGFPPELDHEVEFDNVPGTYIIFSSF